jgi:hypothetical protein
VNRAQHKKWLTSIALAWALFYGVLDHFLHLPFPDGMILDWFGR